MATRFEIILQGEDRVRLRAVGEEALAEIHRLEAQLSFYRPTSELCRINATAAQRPVKVEARMFELLRRSHELYQATNGAFDPTIAPLMRCWGFVNDMGCMPLAEGIAEALNRTGMEYVIFDQTARTIAFSKQGISLDLGGIGKGFALDEVVWLLQELGIERAFIHGGTSTMFALGSPYDAERWRIALPYPDNIDSDAPDAVFAVLELQNEALSVSAVQGKAFAVDGKTYGHVIDPRIGWPVDGAVMAAVTSSSATDTDALSTALLVEGQASAYMLDNLDNDVGALVLEEADTHHMFDVYQRNLRMLPEAKRINHVIRI